MAMLGVPYGDAAIDAGDDGAGAGAGDRRPDSRRRAGPRELEDKEIVALVAYLQRLGTDISQPRAGRTGADRGRGAAAERSDMPVGHHERAGLPGYAEIGADPVHAGLRR